MSGQDSSRGESVAASGIRWQIFALACGASFLLYLHRYSWSVVGPKLQEEFAFTHTQTGYLLSLFYWTYAAGQIPSGIIIDRFGPHRFLTILILAWSVAVTTVTQTTNFVLLGFCRVIFGAAQAGCYPSLTKVSSQWFPASQRTSLQGWIATTSGRTGGAMAPIILGTFLMGALGMSWQNAVMLLGGVGILYAWIFWRVFRNTPADHPGVNAAELALIEDGSVRRESPNPSGGTQLLPVRQVMKNKTMRFFVVQQFLDAGSDVAFVGLIGTYFLRARGLDISETGLLASLPLWGGALGGIVGGWLNDRLIRSTGSRRWSRSGVGFVGKVIGCIMLLLVARQSSALAAGLCLMIAKFFSDWSQPTTWGTCTDLGGRFSATIFSIINTAGTLGGVAMPVAFGKLLDWYTIEVGSTEPVTKVTDWGPLFLLLAAMYLLSGICWLLVDCTRTIETQAE